MKVICGIDPGITGGIAFLYADGTLAAHDIPNVAGEVDTDGVAKLLRLYEPFHCVIERAQAMPKQGVSSTFKFGQAYGALRATVATLGIPHNLVQPRDWKKHFRLDADKEKSRALAIQYWPGTGFFERKKDHGRAEAALIARYGALTLDCLTLTATVDTAAVVNDLCKRIAMEHA